MHSLNRGVHTENLRVFPNCAPNKMDYRQKMVVPSSEKLKHEEDEDEDLEALRLAALKSLRGKNTLQSTQQPALLPQPANPRVASYPSCPVYGHQRTTKRGYYQNRLPRQNGNVYHPSRVNQNLIEIVPVEEDEAPKDAPRNDPKTAKSDTRENRDTDGDSKFYRYTDNASGSEEEDTKESNSTSTAALTSKSDRLEKGDLEGDESGTEKDVQSGFEESPRDDAAIDEVAAEEDDDDEEEVEEDEEEEEEEDEEEEKPADDDDDILLMADLEEEDSLERLMDEMEREMNVDKPIEKPDKKPPKKEPKPPIETPKPRRKSRGDRQPDKNGTSVQISSSSLPPKAPLRSISPRPAIRAPQKRRSLSPRPRLRKKSPRRSPRRSPPRQSKKLSRDLPRLRSPRKLSPPSRYSPRSPKLSPRPRSPRLSPNRLSPLRKLSPRRSRSPRGRRSRSPIARSPKRSNRSRSPRASPGRLSPRPRSPIRNRSPLRARSPLRVRSPPRARSPPRSKSPRLSPHRSPPMRRVSPRTRSPRLSPRRALSPRTRSPKMSPDRRRNSPLRLRSPTRASPHRSPWNSPRNSPRLSPRRRRSPKESARKNRRSVTPDDKITSGYKREISPLRKAPSSPDSGRSKAKSAIGNNETTNDPILEARRRKFESTKLIDPVNDNKKIKLSKRETSKKVEAAEEVEETTEIRDNCDVAEDDYEITESDLCLTDDYVYEVLEDVASDASSGNEAVAMCVEMVPVKAEKARSKKKKKRDKELYQVGKMKGEARELALSERIGKEKKCKKRKDRNSSPVESSPEPAAAAAVEDLTVDEEGDLRTELSRRRAERLNRAAPIQSARLLQSAFKGVVKEVAKTNAKVQRHAVKGEDKSNKKEVRRVTVLHRPVTDLPDSEEEAEVDSKVPVRFRLGLNKPAAQDSREPKAARKSSKRQGRKVKHKNSMSLTDHERNKQ